MILKKKLLGLILSVICITNSFGIITTNAEGKIYEVKSATFNVDINKDGSATIKETWVLDFIEGNFKQFYKDIYRDVEYFETFDNLTIVEASINNVECKEPEEFKVENKDARTSLTWFKKASKETVTYNVEYTLDNIIKKCDEGYIFSYRFIGMNFDKNIDNVAISVNNDVYKNFYITQENYTVNDTYTEYSIESYQHGTLLSLTLLMEDLPEGFSENITYEKRFKWSDVNQRFDFIISNKDTEPLPFNVPALFMIVTFIGIVFSAIRNKSSGSAIYYRDDPYSDRRNRRNFYFDKRGGGGGGCGSGCGGGGAS